jgi:hypothetical protein
VDWPAKGNMGQCRVCSSKNEVKQTFHDRSTHESAVFNLTTSGFSDIWLLVMQRKYAYFKTTNPHHFRFQLYLVLSNA